MKKYITLVLLTLLSITNQGQVISGIIIDKQTNEKVWYASVFISGTFIGTSSDENGEFQLELPNNTSMPLTISAVGYFSYLLDDYKYGENHIIYLKPKTHKLTEVVVKDESLVRQRAANMKRFKAEFLGNTQNSSRCEIMNEQDITFNYDNNDDTLQAFALNPIKIENKGLGYEFTYYLDEFTYIRESKITIYRGSIIFTDDLIDEDRRAYTRRRKTSYFGSRMHFLRALWDDSLRWNGFTINYQKLVALTYSDVVFEEDSLIKFITCSDSLFIRHHSGRSFIIPLEKHVYFQQDGYFDPQGIIWSGNMGNYRMADWLPYEYSVDF